MSKPLDQFKTAKGYRQGRRSWCRICENAYATERKRVDPVRWSRVLQRRRLKKTYGITVAEYDRMCRKGCHVCGAQHETGRRLAIDHNHATGARRGALCRRCNMVIGLMKDDADLLRRAAAYLRKHAPTVAG